MLKIEHHVEIPPAKFCSARPGSVGLDCRVRQHCCRPSPRADSVVTNAAPEPHSDGVAYLLMLFCICLSMVLLCRGSNRSPDVRLKSLEEE